MLARRLPVPVPGLKAPLTIRAVPLVLEYYGAASPARTAACNGYNIRPDIIQQVLDKRADHDLIRLTELTWMQGRYVLDGAPVDCRSGATTARLGP